MRPSTCVLLAHAVVVSLGCADESRLLPDLPCFDADKLRAEPLIFGALTQDPGAPDGWSGVEVHFQADPAGRLTARIRERGGAASPTRGVDRVSYDARHDSISFTYRMAGNTRFTRTFRPSCSRLVGSSIYFRSQDDTSGISVVDTLPRVQK